MRFYKGQESKTGVVIPIERIGVNATVFKNPVTGVAKRVIQLITGIHSLRPEVEFYLFSPHEFDLTIIPNIVNRQILNKVITPAPTLTLNQENYWLHHLLPSLLLKYRIDLFDAPWGGGLPYKMPAKIKKELQATGIRWITTIHDLIPLDYLPVKKGKEAGKRVRKENWVSRWFFKRRLLHNLKMADQIVTVSAVTRDKMVKLLVELLDEKEPGESDKLIKKIFISPNGIGNMFLSSMDKSSLKGGFRNDFEEARKRILRGKQLFKSHSTTKLAKSPVLSKLYSLSEVSSYIFYIGGFNERKNLRNLFTAYHRYLKEPRDSHAKMPWLVIAGKSNSYFERHLLPVIKSLKLDRVILLDYLPEDQLPLLYSQAELVVYPSLLEGFGMPALEALACEKTVLVDDQIAQILAPYIPKEACHLLFSGDLSQPEIFFQLLTQLLENEITDSPSKKSSTIAGKKAVANWPSFWSSLWSTLSWQNIARDYLKILEGSNKL